jgi:hypothetical protein
VTLALLVALLAAALGTDLGLALLVLGGLARLGALPPELGALHGLGSPWLMAATALIWFGELVAEQASVAVMTLWHAVQAVARPLAALLVVGAVADAGNELALAGLAALLTALVHAGAVGWQAFLHIAGVPRRTRFIASLAEDSAVAALLALGLDHPAPAAALLVVLAVAAPRHHLTSLAGVRFLVRSVVGSLRRLLRRGRWTSSTELPAWVPARLREEAGELRGSPVGLLGPQASRLRCGWLLVGPAGHFFVPRFGRPRKLEAASVVRLDEGALAIRVRRSDGLTLLVPPDGPGAGELEAEFGPEQVTDASRCL